MAVVRSGVAGNGARWRIHDDDYIRNTPEENARRRAYACGLAHQILIDVAMKEQKEEQNGQVFQYAKAAQPAGDDPAP